MGTVTKVGFRQAKGRGVAKGIVNVATITGSYAAGGITVTVSPALKRVDWAQATLLSGYGAADEAFARVSLCSGTGFRLVLEENTSGVSQPLSGYIPRVAFAEIPAASISGSQIRYFAMGE